MINHVHAYLHKYYILNPVKRFNMFKTTGESSICEKIDEEYVCDVYPNTLLKELKTIFSIEQEELKFLIDSWALSIRSNANLIEWWKREEWTIEFPEYVYGVDTAISGGSITVMRTDSDGRISSIGALEEARRNIIIDIAETPRIWESQLNHNIVVPSRKIND